MPELTKTRVHIADDFRDNLIIDRYDPVFVTMRASKLKHLRSENSEDAVTWNVFRSFRQIDTPDRAAPVSTRGRDVGVHRSGRARQNSGGIRQYRPCKIGGVPNGFRT